MHETRGGVFQMKKIVLVLLVVCLVACTKKIEVAPPGELNKETMVLRKNSEDDLIKALDDTMDFYENYFYYSEGDTPVAIKDDTVTIKLDEYNSVISRKLKDQSIKNDIDFKNLIKQHFYGDCLDEPVLSETRVYDIEGKAYLTDPMGLGDKLCDEHKIEITKLTDDEYNLHITDYDGGTIVDVYNPYDVKCKFVDGKFLFNDIITKAKITIEGK